MIKHKVAHLELGPTTAAVNVANRLQRLEPLAAVDSALAALEQAKAVAAKRAVETDQTNTVIANLRTASKQRRSTGV